ETPERRSDAVEADFEPEVHRREVQRLGEGANGRHLPVRAVLVVPRRPRPAVAELESDGHVVDLRRERVAAPLERREVNGGLDQRADLTPRVERAVEAVEARPLAADERADLGIVRIRHDNGPFERRPARRRALEPFELAVERLLGRRLRQRLERRVDPEAALLEILVVVVPPKLAADEIHERGIVRGAPALYGDDAELSILCIRERYRID